MFFSVLVLPLLLAPLGVVGVVGTAGLTMMTLQEYGRQTQSPRTAELLKCFTFHFYLRTHILQDPNINIFLFSPLDYHSSSNLSNTCLAIRLKPQACCFVFPLSCQYLSKNNYPGGG